MTDRQHALYGRSDGRWLLVTFVGAPAEPPIRMGDLPLLGEPSDVLARIHDGLRQQQKKDVAAGREARAAYGRALAAWEAADPATRGPAPEPPPGWQPAKRGPRPGVQQQLAERLGVGQQAVSRYLNRRTEMALSDEGWSALVRAHFEEVTE